MKVAFKKTYISGPMSGIPEYNYPEFHRVAKLLRERGWNIVSPAEIPTPPTELEGQELWEYCMKLCMEMMDGCDSIIMLQGWPESRGANIELKKAQDKGMVVFYFDPYLEAAVRMSGRSRNNVEARMDESTRV